MKLDVAIYEGMLLLDKIVLLLQFYFHRGDSFRTVFTFARVERNS